MSPRKEVLRMLAGPVYTEGVCQDGAAILKDGKMMKVHEIVAELNAATRLGKFIQEVARRAQKGVRYRETT